MSSGGELHRALHKLEADDAKVAHVEQGHRPTIVYLHANPTSILRRGVIPVVEDPVTGWYAHQTERGT